MAALSIGPRGKARKFVRYAPRNDNTRAAAKRLLDELVQGAQGTTSTMTLGAYLRRWLDDYDVGPSQRANAESLVRLWIDPLLGGVRVCDVRPSDVREVLLRVRKTRSAQLARHTYNVLAVALDRAERDEIIRRNPVRLVDRPAVRRVEKRPWTTEQVGAFLRAAADDRYFALYLMAAATGLRQGELLGLTWDDVDLERGRITVAHQLKRIDGKYARIAPKGNRPPRVVEAPAIVVETLRKHRTDQLADRLLAGVPTAEGLVFVTEAGRPVHGSVVTHRLQRIARAAGLPPQTFHGFRRFHASLAAELGIHPNVEMAALGHANVSTTLSHYVYTSTDQARDAASRVDRALRTG